MASYAYKRLGATVVTADTDTALYTVPASTQTIMSNITVCNRGTSTRTFRVAHVDGAIGDVANDDYLAYDCNIDPNSSIVICSGISMGASETILVRANHADVNFVCSGVEIT